MTRKELQLLRAKVKQLKKNRLDEMLGMIVEDGIPVPSLKGKTLRSILQTHPKMWQEQGESCTYWCYRKGGKTVNCEIKKGKCVRAFAVEDDPYHTPESPSDIILKKLWRSALASPEITKEDMIYIFGENISIEDLTFITTYVEKLTG